MLTLSASVMQACLSLIFLLALQRLESGRGILWPWSAGLQQSEPATAQASARRMARYRRMKLLLWVLLIASGLATLCDLSPMVGEWLR